MTLHMLKIPRVSFAQGMILAVQLKWDCDYVVVAELLMGALWTNFSRGLSSRLLASLRSPPSGAIRTECPQVHSGHKQKTMAPNGWK